MAVGLLSISSALAARRLCDDERVDDLDDDVYVATPMSLVTNFRNALSAILPAAKAARLSPLDEHQHYEWEHLAQTMFDVFVRQPVAVDRHRSPDDNRLVPYDIDLPDYSKASWLDLGSPSTGHLAFVRFLTIREPFDTVQVAEVAGRERKSGDRRNLAWPPDRLEFVRTGSGTRLETVTEIVAVE